MKASSSLGKHWPTKGLNLFSIEYISSCSSLTSILSIGHSFQSVIPSFGSSFNSTQFFETLPWTPLAIKSSSTCAILKQKLKKQSTSYYMIYELYLTNKMKIIIPSWDNSFKSKQFIETNWWVSLASTLSSIGAILKQEFKI